VGDLRYGAAYFVAAMTVNDGKMHDWSEDANDSEHLCPMRILKGRVHAKQDPGSTRRRDPPRDAVDLDDDMPPDTDLAHRPSTPYRFAKCRLVVRGDARPGAGRRPAPESVRRVTKTFCESRTAYLRTLDVTMSRAVRKRIVAARRVVSGSYRTSGFTTRWKVTR
jgi:hypothetical protein